MRYSIEKDPDKSAKAFGRELQCSPRHSQNIARTIRGIPVKDAKKILEDIIALKRPIEFMTHRRRMGHKKGMSSGAYPEKASRKILRILEDAENNAEYKGLDPENMIISHISTYKGRGIEGLMPRAYGRATNKTEQTTNVEIILEEIE
jgi:large subunit ribosomal protein L22